MQLDHPFGDLTLNDGRDPRLNVTFILSKETNGRGILRLPKVKVK